VDGRIDAVSDLLGQVYLRNDNVDGRRFLSVMLRNCILKLLRELLASDHN
jgi:hypothetical protein